MPKRLGFDYLQTLARVSYFVESGQPFSCTEIARQTGDTPRTVMRYLDELRGLGFETELVPAARGGYRLRGAGKARIEKVIEQLLREWRSEAT